MRALAKNRRISCVFSSRGIDNGDEMWLMEIVTKEVRNAYTTPRRQPPARAISTLETARDFPARQSSDGGLTDTVDWTEMELPPHFR